MKVKWWNLSVPVRVHGSQELRSLRVDDDSGVVSIDAQPGGIVLVEREGAPTLVLQGPNFGEVTDDEEIALGTARGLALASKRKSEQAPGNKSAAVEAQKQAGQVARG